MHNLGRRRFLRHLAGGALLLVAPLAATQPQEAAAATKITRSNLVVTLSDGRTVQMLVEVASGPARIKQIAYGIKAPQGTAIAGIAYTGGVLKGKEKVYFVADHAPDTFTTGAQVTGVGKTIKMKITTIMQRRPATVSGLTGQRLVMNFNLAR